MSGLRYALLGDGPSDRLLLHPIGWALRAMNVAVDVDQWADLSLVRPKPRTLVERLHATLELYPSELLFLHRDAETATHDERLEEVREAAAQVSERCVAVIPVRMTEAWLLHDEAAIRRASGNPNGTVGLRLASPSRVERDVDPKETLRTALLTASELSGRRRKKKAGTFGDMRARTAELITDYGPLRDAPAFQAFLADLESALMQLGRSPSGDRAGEECSGDGARGKED